MAEKQHSNEWYTPAKYIEAAREVMGSIDLDPASCEAANQTVRATRYYTQAENGLAKPWYGNVWLNPPYARDNAQPNEYKSGVKNWVHKLIAEYQTGSISQAIALLMLNINKDYFQLLWQYPICFPDHNIRFYVPYGRCAKSDPSKAGRRTHTHMFGSLFVYLGSNEQKFIEVFSEFGRIAKAIDTPRCVEKPIPLWDVERIYA